MAPRKEKSERPSAEDSELCRILTGSLNTDRVVDATMILQYLSEQTLCLTSSIHSLILHYQNSKSWFYF